MNTVVLFILAIGLLLFFLRGFEWKALGKSLGLRSLGRRLRRIRGGSVKKVVLGSVYSLCFLVNCVYQIFRFSGRQALRLVGKDFGQKKK